MLHFGLAVIFACGKTEGYENFRNATNILSTFLCCGCVTSVVFLILGSVWVFAAEDASCVSAPSPCIFGFASHSWVTFLDLISPPLFLQPLPLILTCFICLFPARLSRRKTRRDIHVNMVRHDFRQLFSRLYDPSLLQHFSVAATRQIRKTGIARPSVHT